MPCETGTAILLHFSMHIDCVRYVMQITAQLTAHQFTLTFVDISVIDNPHVTCQQFLQTPVIMITVYHAGKKRKPQLSQK